MVEIVEQVYVEIKNYGHDDQKKMLIAGIVLTGGGSQLKHLKQLVEYITGMDTRIGYPNEHLAGDSEAEIASPLYATAVGLLMNAVENKDKRRLKTLEEEKEREMVLEGHEDMNTTTATKKNENRFLTDGRKNSKIS